MTETANLLDASSPAPDAPDARGRSYTAGFVDELGDRQLVFDHATSASLEVLRLKKAFSDSPEFEAALRARVEEVRHLQHPSLATIHGVERRGEEGLCLISKLTSGRRVSELASKAHGAAFALELIRLVTPALAMLQRAGDGVAHGALSAERIVATRDGRLVVVEHALGSAIEALKLSRSQLIDLGVVVPDGSEPIRFDSRTDLTQLGFIALSLLVGRRLDAADYPEKVPALLDEFVLGAGSPILSAKLRGWLERAMQISPRSFASARDAQEALGGLPDDVDVRMAELTGALSTFPAEVAATTAPAPTTRRHQAVESKTLDHSPAGETADLFAQPQGSSIGGSGRPAAGWITAALAVLAAFEAVAIAALLYTRPSIDAIEIRAPRVEMAGGPASGPLPPLATSGQAAIGSAGLATAAAIPPNAPPAPEIAAPSAAVGSRFGGMTVSSVIDLQVFQDGKLVGSTAGPIAVSEGPHNLEFVNETLGFRFQKTVNIRGGQMTPVSIAVPNGRISINAVPWAEVTIDGTPAGETPIANLSLPIGTHEIVFRHPQLGERKQTVVVKVDGLVRVTQTLQPAFKY